MELSPEQQAAIDAQKAQCPFCQIVNGKIPSKKVYEDDLLLGILDINPASKGHILLLPKEHYPIMPLIPPDTFKELFRKANALSKVCQKALLCSSTTMFIANGGAAGQQSSHFMMHVIPRDKGDGLECLEPPKNDLDDSGREEILMKVKPILNAMLNKNLAQLGYVKGQTGAVQKMTKEQLVQTLKTTQGLREYIEKDREGFKKVIPTHPQLSVLFEGFDVDEILDEVQGKKKGTKNLKEENDVKSEKEEDTEDNDTNNEEEADLDSIASLLG